MEIFDGVKHLEQGDIIELEGKKYYMEYYDGRPCGWCAFSGILCKKYFSPRHKEYDCARNCVYAISAEKKIKEIEEDIKESKELIKKLQ
jgi:hypothetical protein